VNQETDEKPQKDGFLSCRCVVVGDALRTCSRASLTPPLGVFDAP
jgi:hypothetical protein